MTKIFNKSGGCNEDCLNCKYPDCFKPTQDISVDESLQKALQSPEGKSGPHIYTLELGGVGKDRPNLSRKFYL